MVKCEIAVSCAKRIIKKVFCEQAPTAPYARSVRGSLLTRDIKTTVSTWHDTFCLMSGIVPVHGNMSTPSETAHLQLQTDAICGKFDIHITVLTIEVYGNKSA